MKPTFKFLNFFFSGYFNLIASLCSVIGLLIAIFFSANPTIVALCALVVFLILILFRVFFVTSKFILQKTEGGYHKFATYVRYSTDDGKHLIYEVHKFLQCKKVLMDEYVHDFYWTGTQPPLITSSMQDFVSFVHTPSGDYDKAIFRFRKPVIYNDFVIVHIKMDLDDSDERSSTHCEQTIKESVQLLNFRIELRHLATHPDAKVMKRRINSQLIDNWELVTFVPFDATSKSYEISLAHPETGYSYKLIWER